ncbi:hypothetical protein CELD12_02480 [Cellulomonas sp. NTE-D12]|nr:hypothetical protein CELD12_02480 [Cellulomonas sp. NTE-D12]
MPITIRRTGEAYTAEVTPPHGRGQTWRTPRPLGRHALVAALIELGCHQTDTGDAFYAADPEWLERR